MPDGVSFDLRLQQNFWQKIWGGFVGTMINHPISELSDWSSVEGSLGFGRFSFTEYQPVLPVVPYLGPQMTKLEFQEQRRAKWKMAPRYFPVYFRGKFHSETEASGDWFQKESRIPSEDGTYTVFSQASGTFQLCR